MCVCVSGGNKDIMIFCVCMCVCDFVWVCVKKIFMRGISVCEREILCKRVKSKGIIMREKIILFKINIR